MANVKSEKRTETVIYSQLQPWSTIGVLSCMEQAADLPISVRIAEFRKTSRSHPWHPTLGYKILEAAPLFAQPITNLMLGTCRIPYGMTTKPLKFPNLVTGFDRSPSHAARAALNMRYTPYDWKQNQIRLCNEADMNMCYSEKLRKDSECLIKEADEKKQIENDQKLEEGITCWRNEVASELEKFKTEDNKMQECRHDLQIAIQNIDRQLHIAQECLYLRESRGDTDLVRDEVETALLKEIEIVRNCENQLEQFTNKCINQLTNNRAMQYQLHINIRNKELGINVQCHRTNDFSRDLQSYDKTEKYDPSITEIESWAKMANIVKESEVERMKSCHLRSDIDNVMSAVSYEIYEARENTNKALDKRAIEILEAKEKLQTHLHKIQEEILSIEKNMKLIRKTIADKNSELKVANIRPETKMYYPESELCKDSAKFRITNEVKNINKMIYNLNLILQQCEMQYQQLLHARSNLESNLMSKTDALFIDKEKCMGLRKSYPISLIIKF
ncbi:tektin-3-like [Cataglyphis hispanica]|uniref:tektin-3-like n=1 Tax=Cataglyphis hispanica TaxID=1086592 RepID=UPI002180614F|nr:tektin-3-like [Cataglyphis hispanica]